MASFSKQQAVNTKYRFTSSRHSRLTKGAFSTLFDSNAYVESTNLNELSFIRTFCPLAHGMTRLRTPKPTRSALFWILTSLLLTVVLPGLGVCVRLASFSEYKMAGLYGVGRGKHKRSGHKAEPSIPGAFLAFHNGHNESTKITRFYSFSISSTFMLRPFSSFQRGIMRRAATPGSENEREVNKRPEIVELST